MLVKQILSTKPHQDILTIAPDENISEAAQVLSAKKIGALVVSASGDTAEGILSERDIVREIGKRGYSCMSDKVSEMMTSKPVTCSPDDSADQVLELMTSGRFRHIPVVEGGKMTGLISIGDVVKARLAELSMEKDALEGMIMGH